MADDSQSTGEALSPLTVRATAGGATFSVQGARSSWSVSELKTAVESVAGVGVAPVDGQRLIYKGHVMKDTESLGSYGITPGATLHLVVSKKATGSAPTTAPATPAPASASAPFGGMGGMFGGGGPFSSGGAAPGAGEMAAFARSPMARALLNNPEALAALVAASPPAAALAASNPELAAALRDPATLRAALAAALDPAASARAHDLALANIEATPGGFNALRQMHETLGGAFEAAVDASAGGGGAPSSSAGASSQAAALAAMLSAAAGAAPASPASPNAEALPNPWGPPPPVTAAAPGSGGGFGAFPPQLDPASRAALADMMSSPGALEAMMAGAPPAVRAVWEANPGVRATLTDPAAVRALLESGLMGGGGVGGGAPSGAATAAAPLDLASLAAALSGGGGGGAPAPPSTRPADPEAAYAAQLEAMEAMGLTATHGRAAVVDALVAAGGSVAAAVDRLLG